MNLSLHSYFKTIAYPTVEDCRRNLFALLFFLNNLAVKGSHAGFTALTSPSLISPYMLTADVLHCHSEAN